MTHNESFHFPGPAGNLEALLMMPAGEPLASAIVCHANPEEGGMMHFKVVFRAAKALQAAGAAVLRFNFRGVGSSQGTHDQGRGEQDDVRAALDEMARRFPGTKQVLGGFSFGSVMAMAVGASDARAAALFALGFPARIDSMTARLPAMAARAVPRLFVQGE
jgi:alpha/beta superfamily hydrolase